MRREPRPHAIVAGAGVGGLAAALALARAGCSVSILERQTVLAEAGAGLQLSPNATRVLGRLNVLDRLRGFAVAPAALRIRRARDAALLALAPLGPSAERRWGAPTLVIHRADFQRGLLEAIAREPAISVSLSTSVAGHSQDAEGVKIGATCGPAGVTFSGDFLVGADGLHSTVRSRLDDSPSDRPIHSGRTAWRALIPAADLDRRFLAPETNLWLGRRAHLVHYPLRGGAVVNVVAIVEDAYAGDEASADTTWSLDGNPALLARSFADWHSEPRGLVAAASAWRRWPLFERPALARWTRGRIALVGDAAHPMLPFLAQGAAQAIEDAAALADAVAAAPGDVPAALEAYARARRVHAGRVQRQSRRQGSIYHLSGLAALGRDLVMRAVGARVLLARYDWIYRGSG